MKRLRRLALALVLCLCPSLVHSALHELPVVLDDQIEGRVAVVLDASSFALEGGPVIVTDPMAQLIGFTSVSALSPGDLIRAGGIAAGDQFRASWVELLDGSIAISGMVAYLIDTVSFVLQDGTVVETGPTTVFNGITGVTDLTPGDWVDLEGEWLGQSFLARSVSLVTQFPAWVFGIVISSSGTTFQLDDGTVVVTDAATVFVGVSGVNELGPGDLVEAYGSWAGCFLAIQVERLATGSDPETTTANVAFLDPPDRISLDTGLVAIVHSGTQYIGLSGYSDLSVGDQITVVGYYDPWRSTVVAASVELLAPGGPTYTSFEGTVQSVSLPNVVRLDDGSTLIVDAQTTLVGFSSIADLAPGDILWVEAFTTDVPGTYAAITLTLIETPSTPVEFVSEIVTVSPPDHFATANGYQVWVDATTVFIGFASLAELAPGYTVSVLGYVDPHRGIEVHAESVELTDGEDPPSGGGGGGSGLVSTVTGTVTNLILPDRFELDRWYTVTTTDTTEWRGDLSEFGDLDIGTIVLVELLFSDGLEALSVENIGWAGSEIVALEGAITAVYGEGWFQLESGEWVLINDLTELDGDVDSVDEIELGMYLKATAVPLELHQYQALSALVELDPEDLSDLGFEPGEEILEALVVLSEDAVPTEVASRHGAAVAGSLPGRLVYLFQWSAAAGEDDILALLADPEVEDVEPNHRFQDPEADPEAIRRRSIAIDRMPTSNQFNGQKAGEVAALAEAHLRTQGLGTLVAIVDTGIDPFHPLLRHRIGAGGWDFVDNDDEPWETADGIDQDNDGEIDESAGHGTFVAGLVLLAAPGTTIVPYRALDDDGHGSTFNICLAVLEATARGVDVINMSFSYKNRARVLDRILMEASRRGIVLVSGAGNTASTDLPFPASDSRVIAVAAVDELAALADFSNRGPAVGIAAPGVDVYSSAMNGAFGTWSGTSMAAPLVSGVAALLRSVNPYLTPEQIADALVQSAGEVGGTVEPMTLLQAAPALDLIPSGP